MPDDVCVGRDLRKSGARERVDELLVSAAAVGGGGTCCAETPWPPVRDGAARALRPG